MVKTGDREQMSLRRLMREMPSPPGLAVRVLASIRKKSAERLMPNLAFDIVASPAGIVQLTPGSGRTQVRTARGERWAEEARKELSQYLAGERSYFTVPLDLSPLAPFQLSVLTSLRKIPFGELRSYRWVAQQIGRPMAARAVGRALGDNPLPLLIPCHRILRSDGSLGGYALGLSLKARLLRLEEATPIFVGSTTTKIVCQKGCRRENRIATINQVVFASLEEAVEVGYRSCLLCRPGTVAS